MNYVLLALGIMAALAAVFCVVNVGNLTFRLQVRHSTASAGLWLLGYIFGGGAFTALALWLIPAGLA